MPKPLSPDQLYNLYESGVAIHNLNPEVDSATTNLPAGSVMRALGSVGLPHSEVIDRLDEPSTNEALKWAPAVAALERTEGLLRLTVPEISFGGLNSPELANINWRRLKEIRQVYRQLNIPSEVVITPEGEPLEFWRVMYIGLRKWQDAHSSVYHRGLKKHSNGDGLLVEGAISANWDQLVQTENPRWSALVVPTSPVVLVTKVDHNGLSSNATIPRELTKILNDFPGKKLIHPSAECYLMMQAIRIKAGLQPLDGCVDSVNYWSWLEGEFYLGQAKRALCGIWSPDSNRVSLHHGSATGSGETVGVRPSGRG